MTPQNSGHDPMGLVSVFVCWVSVLKGVTIANFLIWFWVKKDCEFRMWGVGGGLLDKVAKDLHVERRARIADGAAEGESPAEPIEDLTSAYIATFLVLGGSFSVGFGLCWFFGGWRGCIYKMFCQG